MAKPGELTERLAAWSGGDDAARDEAFAIVYAELRRIARNRLRREGEHVTLQTTGLVHEAYLRLADQRTRWQSRAHFFAIAARVMRRILVEAHRARRAQKRTTPGTVRVSIDEAEGLIAAPAASVDVERLSDALDLLARQDPRQASVVELRTFAGLTIEETAEALAVSPITVKREWALARAWLKRELTGAA